MEIHLTSAVLSSKVDWGRSRGWGICYLFSSPLQGNYWSFRADAVSPPTNVAWVVFKSSYNVWRPWVFLRMQARSGTFNGSSSERGQGKGLCVFESFPWPLARLKRKGLTKRSNTKLIFIFYFLSHNLFIKFIIILHQFQEKRHWRYSPCWKSKRPCGNDVRNSRFP